MHFWEVIRLFQRQCEIGKDIVDNYRTVFESRISREEQKNCHSLKILVFLHGFMIWRVTPRNVWNDIVSWQTDDSATLQSINSMH